jgi:hypothetical protein
MILTGYLLFEAKKKNQSSIRCRYSTAYLLLKTNKSIIKFSKKKMNNYNK